MFVYEKKLQYPVRIKNCNPKLAAVIISQYGGPYFVNLLLNSCNKSIISCKKHRSTVYSRKNPAQEILRRVNFMPLYHCNINACKVYSALRCINEYNIHNSFIQENRACKAVSLSGFFVRISKKYNSHRNTQRKNAITVRLYDNCLFLEEILYKMPSLQEAFLCAMVEMCSCIPFA